MLRIDTPPLRLNPTILSGHDVYRGLKKISGTRCLVIISKSIFNRDEISNNIKNNLNCEIIKLFDPPWGANPNISNLSSLILSFEEIKPDLIIVAGGGSTIDAVKAARALYEMPELLPDLTLKRTFKISKHIKSKFVIIPSTIGTGSEASTSAVLKTAVGDKMFFIGDSLLADWVILDPSVIEFLPAELKLSTMCDALAHSVESYVSTIQHPIAEDFSVWALNKINLYWKKGLDSRPEREVLFQLQLAALYAGYAQNHMLVGAAHVMSHIYEKHGLSHGLANAHFLPATIKVNRKNPDVHHSYNKLALAAGMVDGVDGLLQLSEKMRNGCKKSIKPISFGMQEYMSAKTDPSGVCNPIEIGDEYLDNINSEAFNE